MLELLVPHAPTPNKDPFAIAEFFYTFLKLFLKYTKTLNNRITKEKIEIIDRNAFIC
jgi:hypothetical protein